MDRFIRPESSATARTPCHPLCAVKMSAQPAIRNRRVRWLAHPSPPVMQPHRPPIRTDPPLAHFSLWKPAGVQ
jgi:hypothetical protein